jgi:Protein of unknown function (DUF3047)
LRHNFTISARASVAVVTGACLLAVTAWAGDPVVVDDWRSYPLGTRGIPGGWKGQNWGDATYDLEIVADNDQPSLRLKSNGGSSTISRDLGASVDLKRTPVLQWSWKVMTLPGGGHACNKSTDDQAAQVYVVWLRAPEALRSRIIGYIWDSTARPGTICKSQKTSTVTYIVLRSGFDELGKWVTERRNVVEDFRTIYGEAPDNPSALSLSIDSNDTRSSADALIGPTVFTPP